ncbi:radical SAM protein [Streptomyces sp. 147326]|uniref:radical SAM protein n=1 Tax=Streptomyces sp. 147326 TaxID=3074379 RepID=UPI003857A9EF
MAPRRTPPPSDSPVTALHRLFLWINSGCNSRCRMCDIWREKPGRHLTVEEIRAWVPQWQALSLSKVVVCGEPLMHPDVWRITEVIREHGIQVELLSNGLLLERHAAAVAAQCDAFRVSLDGPQHVHDKVRDVPDAYKRLRRGLRALREIRPDLAVDGRCAVHRHNFRHLRETVEAARDLGLHSISFSSTDLHNEEAFRRFGVIDDPYVESLAIVGEDLAELERELAALRRDHAEDFASGFISDTPEELDRLLLSYNRAVAGQAEFPEVRCNSPWSAAILEYDGTVRPCFPMPAYGTVHEHGGLEQAVNSPRALEFRRQLDVLTDTTCRYCVCPTVNHVG